MTYSDRTLRRAASAFLVVLSIAVFSPTVRNGFINLDDMNYVVENPHIHSLNWHLVKWSFTTSYFGNYHPLTWISLALDFALWRADPAGYHALNILFHAMNVWLVFSIARRLVLRYHAAREGGEASEAFSVAFLSALIFGIHPLRVESVAWVAERKDVLCALFSLTSVHWYLSAADATDANGGKRAYFLSFTAFVLAVLSKAMAVSLPLVFLILDLLIPGRTNGIAKAFKSLIVRLVPYVLVSSAVAVAAIASQVSGGGFRGMGDYSLADRFVNASYALGYYPYKTILPTGLSPLHPIIGAADAGSKGVFLSIGIIVVLSIAAVMLYRRGRTALLAAWVVYFVMVLPVSGIMQAGDVGVADRFTYLPMIGLTMLLAAGGLSSVRVATDLLGWHPSDVGLLLPVAFIAVVLLAPLTVQQTAVWHDSLSYAERAVSAYPDSWSIPYLLRGLARLDRGQVEAALLDCSHAVAVDSRCIKCLMCRAEAQEKLGRVPEAIRDYDSVLLLDISNVNARNNRGVLFLKRGELDKAYNDFYWRDYYERRSQ